MDKNEIQNFLLWYSPAALLTLAIYFAMYFSSSGSISWGLSIDFIATYLGNFICAFWLWVNCSTHRLNKWLWAVVALGLGIYCMFFYFLYVATNKAKHDGAS